METTCASVEEKVKSFAEGELEHATEIISALWEIANKDDEIKAPADTSSAVSSFNFHPFPVSCGSTHFIPPDRAA